MTVGFVLSIGASNQGASSNAVDIAIIALLVAAGLHTFLTRKTSEPPKWMGKLETADPKLSFRLGFLLLGIFPTDILTSLAVGGTVAGNGDPWWQILPFVAMVVLFVASPSLLVVVLGQRGQTLLPKVRDWMNDNSWVVSEIVILLFIALTANSLAG